jgi:hypothetical protein
MAKVIVSQLNPVNFLNMDRINLEKYFSLHMDDYMNYSRLNIYQQGFYSFKQIWGQMDALRLQVISDAGQPTISFLNCNGSQIVSFTMDEILVNETTPTFKMYEKSYSFSIVPNGVFYIKLVSGQLSLISEPMLMSDELSNTLLIEYKNRSFYQNMIFENGFFSTIRINGLLKYQKPGSKNTMYEDQILDMVMLKSKPYRIWNLIVGFQTPVADFFIDKLNRVFGCSSVMIDGKYFALGEESKWEEIESVNNGAFKIYSIELREMVNKNSKVFDTEPEQITGIFTDEFVFEFQ